MNKLLAKLSVLFGRLIASLMIFLFASMTTTSSASAETYKFGVKLTLEEFNADTFNRIDIGCQVFSEPDQGGQLINAASRPLSSIDANITEQMEIEVVTESTAKSWACRTFGRRATDSANSHFGITRPSPWQVRSGSVAFARGNFETVSTAPALDGDQDIGTPPETPTGPDTSIITPDGFAPFRP